MIKIFLQAKHWQIFLMTFGIPFVAQFVFMAVLIFGIESGASADPGYMFRYIMFFPLIMVVFVGVLFSWFWSVGVGLHRLLPPDNKLKVNRFKILLILAGVWIISYFVIILSMMFSEGGFDPLIFALIVPLNFPYLICIVYCMVFISKTLKTAELQKNLTFGDFAGEFFMLLMFPIGIWILQPRINELVEEKKDLIDELG